MPPQRSHLDPQHNHSHNLLSFDLSSTISPLSQFPFQSNFPSLPQHSNISIHPPIHPPPPLQQSLHSIKPKRFVSRPLQRNQACSTCRSRKVRCDASKPACGACRRSAAAHGENPDIVSCHYDSDSQNNLSIDSHLLSPLPTSSSDADHPKKTTSKVAILQQKIANLEELIAKLNLQSHNSLDLLPLPDSIPNSQLPIDHVPSAPIAAFPHSSLPSLPPRPPTDRPPDVLLWSNWPPTLPSRPILSHLVRLFLAHNTGTGQTIFLDHPALLAALHLPPHHPHFPPQALLHAIIALAYRHHPAPDQLAHNLIQTHGPPPYWPAGQPVDQFHYHAAKRAIENALLTGTQLFKTTQALVLVCHYAYRARRLLEVWVLSGLAIRFATPLGLNRLETCAGHLDGSKPRPRVLLPPPRTLAEKYERAATFWCAFQMDRFLSVSSGRAHSIDEQDISSLLPACPGTSMASLGPVDPARNPLALSHAHFFSVHPPDVDARQLELKATVLLGRIAAWLRRAPRPVGFNLEKVWKVPNEPIPDLRTQSEFVRLDQDLISLQLSLPRFITQTIFSSSTSSSCEPVERIDQTKMMVNLIVNVCEMILHECFISREEANMSLRRTTDAAIRCKTLGEIVMSSGFEMRYLNRFMVFCWTVAVRQLMRDLVSTELLLLESLSAPSSCCCSSCSLTSMKRMSCCEMRLEEVQEEYQEEEDEEGEKDENKNEEELMWKKNGEKVEEKKNKSKKEKSKGVVKELQDLVNSRVCDVQVLVGVIGSVEKAIDGNGNGSGDGDGGGGLGIDGTGGTGGGGFGSDGQSRISEGIVEAFEDRFRVFKVVDKLMSNHL